MGKGNKDRYTLFSDKLLKELRENFPSGDLPNIYLRDPPVPVFCGKCGSNC